MGFARDVVGGITGKNAADAAGKASDAQVAATNAAAATTKEMFDQTRKDLAPSRAVGNNALFTLASAMGVSPTLDQLGQTYGLDADQMAMLKGDASAITDSTVSGVRTLYDSASTATPETLLTSDPGYQFRMDQGQKAIERSAAARGGLFSGGTGKALQQYSQGLASQEYGNAFNRLASLAGIGQSATGQQVNANQNQAVALSDLTTQAGNARASGYVGAANAQQQGLQNMISLGTTAALLSDERTKEDIRPVGKTDDGLTIYTYRYKGDPTFRMGVMAQEVEKEQPKAAVTINGVKGVDYSEVH